jgi:hypothetical protein
LGIERGLVFKSIQQLQQKNGCSATSSSLHNLLGQSQHRTPHVLANDGNSQATVNESSITQSDDTLAPKLKFAQLTGDSTSSSFDAPTSQCNQSPLIQCHTSTSSKINTTASHSLVELNSNRVTAKATSTSTSSHALPSASSAATLALSKNAAESHYANTLSTAVSLGQPFAITNQQLTNESSATDAIPTVASVNSDSEPESNPELNNTQIRRPLPGSAGSSLSGSLDSELDSAIHSCSQTLTSSVNCTNESGNNRITSASDHKQWMMKRRPLVVDAELENQLEQVNRLLEQTQQMKLSEDADSLMDLLEEDTAPFADDSEQEDQQSVFDAPDTQGPCESDVVSTSDQPDRGESIGQKKMIAAEPDSTTDETIAVQRMDCESSSSSGNEDQSNSSSSEKENEDCNKRVVMRMSSKSNLKQTGSNSQRLKRRVSFDPLALLLDAALEGELELVKQIAAQVCSTIFG